MAAPASSTGQEAWGYGATRASDTVSPEISWQKPVTLPPPCTGSSRPLATSRQYWSGVVDVAERTIAPLVPPRLSVSAGRQLLATRGGRLPVAELLAPPRAGSLVYGMGKIDTWGVVSNRDTVQALGWAPGDRLQIALVGGSVVVHRDPAGVFAMGPKPYLVLPAAVRHRSGVRPGEPVLVAADPRHDVLVVHPLAALDSMIATYHASLTTGDAA
jgi:hypothetical protein